MFVLMVAELPTLLSAQPPEVPRKAGLGDRFHYFRGASGRRYLFSAIPRAGIGDFHSAVVALARRAPGGRVAAHWIAAIDCAGRPESGRRMPPLTADTIILVHLLATSDAERGDLVADLAPAPIALAAA